MTWFNWSERGKYSAGSVELRPAAPCGRLANFQRVAALEIDGVDWIFSGIYRPFWRWLRPRLFPRRKWWKRSPKFCSVPCDWTIRQRFRCRGRIANIPHHPTKSPALSPAPPVKQQQQQQQQQQSVSTEKIFDLKDKQFGKFWPINFSKFLVFWSNFCSF